MNYSIRAGMPGDIEGLKLRALDLLELRECCDKTPAEQLKESWETSEMRWTVLYGDEVACVLGCVGEKDKFGIPWLLGTKYAERVKKAFLSDLKGCLEVMLKEYRFLINYVHPKNKQSIRWLKWLGFKIEPPVPFGDFDVLFHPFHMVRDV